MTRGELLYAANKFVNESVGYYPLYSCKAKIFKSGNKYVLKSYGEVVAVAGVVGNRLQVYIFDYYSPTTNTTHIPKFCEWARKKFGLYAFEVDKVSLYRTSRMSAYAYNALSADDWSGVIHISEL